MDNITLNQIRYFISVAHNKQITAAALELNISQPPLSYQIKKLEESLGCQLFTRNSRSLDLTDEGKLFYNRCIQITDLLNVAYREVSEYSKGITGTISIGIVSSVSQLFPGKISSIFDNNKNISYEVFEGNTFEVLDLLKQQIIDIAVVRTPFPTNGLETKTIITDPMVAIGKSSLFDKLDNDKQKISVLENKKLIIYRRYEDLIKQTCLQEGFYPNVICYNEDARTTLSWASQGIGIGIVPKSALINSTYVDCHLIELDEQQLVTSIVLVWNKNKKMSLLTETLIDQL